PASVRVYLCLTPCDMRRSFDGLHALVREHLRRTSVCVRQPTAGSGQDSVRGPRRVCDVEQAPGGGHVRNAVGRGRRGTPARDREFTERNKIEALLRELLDAKRNRKSEQLSADQLALLATLWQARQAEAPSQPDDSDDHDPSPNPGTGGSAPKKRAGGRQPLPRPLQ